MKKLLSMMVLISILLSLMPLSLTSARGNTLPGPPPPRGPGRIEVHKFHDVNGNGVQDEGEEDLQGWPMRIYRLDKDQPPVMVAEGTTNGVGTVTFGNLEPGQYKVWEAKQECWELTTSGKAWEGGYVQVVDVLERELTTVEFGNRDTCVPPPPEPCIDLEKTGPATAGPGETVTYHFWVHNCGDVPLKSGAQVYDPLFGDAPIWSGDLEPGAVHEFDRAYTLPGDHCGDFTNHARAVGHSPDLKQVEDSDSWTIAVTCAPAPNPVIDVEKFVSVDDKATWHDADTPPGPRVPAGSETVWFGFVVTNDGNVTLTDITLSDSAFNAAIANQCTVPDELAPGESFRCAIGPFVAIEGQHVNQAKATGDFDGETYIDTDWAKYYGFVAPAPSIDIEKSTNGEDADEPTGPEIPAGDPVTWEYVVTNTGNVDLTDIEVADDQLGLICTIGFLAAGDSATCTAEGIAGEGQYANLGTATGTYGDTTVSDEDPSHYFGDVPSAIELIKTATPSSVAEPGGDVTYTFTVNNLSSVDAVTIDSLIDNVFGDLDGQGDCSVPQTIPAGGSYTCSITVFISGDAGGVHINVATATGTDDDGYPVTDDDDATVTITGEEWDKSSLYFSAGCDGDCEEITATVCNGADSGDMQGTTTWELYWIASGNPKDGTVIASGTINALAADECQVLTYNPADNPNGASGNYMFKAYQRPGHPGTGELWSDACELDCEACEDGDGDGVCDADDNCPGTYNPSQVDSDGDDWGAACDCADNDASVNPGATEVACNGIDDDCDPSTLDSPDGDGDGYGVCEDCDDTDASVNPGATEVTCNSIDDDCDPSTLDSPDNDGDGYGVCEDCNDDDASVNPGATEVTCNGIDDDCDPSTSDNPDNDGDGYGVCEDCNDDDANVNPGADEVCGDGMDNDCNGEVDEGCEPCISLTKTIGGPYRTSDDEFLDDGIIPIAVKRRPHSSLPLNPENIFYFLVEITVGNCGGTDLTNVVLEDEFSNQAQPFETDDPGNVTITPPPSIPGMDQELLTWSVGTIPAGQSRTLYVKVGTEFNNGGNLEPTSAPSAADEVFYNGRNDERGATVTADGGLSASVDGMQISHGAEQTCADSEGDWDEIPFSRTAFHDKCAQITTTLPFTFSASDPAILPASEPVATTAATEVAAAVDRTWHIIRALAHLSSLIL